MISGHSYDGCCDVWSLGVVGYECLSGNRPFEANEEDALFAKIADGLQEGQLEGSEWTGVSKNAKELISLMVTVDPSKRPDTQTLLAHRYTQVFHWFHQESNLL